MASGRPEGASAVWNQSNPALVMRGAALGRRFYGAFRFGDTRTRDTALDALTGVETEFLEGRVSIATAMAYPMGPVPQDRFLNAAARALGRKPKMASDAIQEPLSHRLTAQEYAELRVETRKLLREMSGALMRGAMRLELPYSLHLLLSDNSLLEAEVRGGREIAQTHTNIDLPLTAWQMDGFDFYHLARTLSLLPGETIGRIHHSGFLDPEMGPIRFDPVLSEIGATRRRAIEFNKTQPYRKVEYGAALEREISDAFFQEMKDARALTTLPLDGVAGREISPTARYVILPRDPEHEDATERWFTWIDVYPESGVDECHVLYVEPTTDVAQFAVWSDSDMPSELRDQLPSFDYAQVNHGSTSDLRRIVAELLAVDENRLTIEY